jgi:hypothetical protein
MSYITFIDNTGRNIIGQLSSETPNTITVKNPVMVLVQPQQNGQLSVQLIPLFLNEFVKAVNNSREFSFTFTKSSIAIGTDFSIDDRILSQYEKLLNSTARKQEEKGPEVIKLFDE